MRQLSFCFLLLLFSCGQSSNKNTIASNGTAESALGDPISDTLTQYIFEDSLKGNQLLKINPSVEFSSGETIGVSYFKYRFKYEGLTYKFLLEHKKATDRSIYINEDKTRVYRKDSKEFKIDSMDLNIDYTESDVYLFKNNPRYLLIVSHPMNWIGLMTRFSFFQLIDIKEKKVIEFIEEGDI